MPADVDSLIADAAQLGVVLRPAQAEALTAFGALLERANRAFNLVSRRDVERLIPRHLLDSLSVAPWLTGDRVLDLGTGAGLPGVPLAIAREDAHFTLIDLSERRIRFVRRVIRSLELGNVTARCGDVRDLPRSETFHCVVSRAVAPPNTLWGMGAPRLRADGRMILMSRAGIADDDSEADADMPTDAVVEARHRLRVPGLEAMHELTLLRHRDATARTPADAAAGTPA